MNLRIVIIVLIGILSGVISASYGLFFMDQPVKYVLINFPIIGVLVTIVNYLFFHYQKKE